MPLISRRTTHRAGSVVFAAVDFLVVIAPSVVLAVTARQGGLPQSRGFDLVIASALIGAVHATIVRARLRDETRHAHRVIDVWISEFDSLVALALGATMLLVIVLGGFAEQHAVMVNNGWPVLWLWSGVQVTAVVISELTGRLVFWWLEERAEGDDPDDIDEYLRLVAHPGMYADDDPWLAEVRAMCLSFPDAAEVEAWGRPAFRAGKIFCVYSGIAERPHGLFFQADDDERPALLEDDRFYLAPYYRDAPWVAFDLGAAPIDWQEVGELVDASYRRVAPKRMVKALDERGARHWDHIVADRTR